MKMFLVAAFSLGLISGAFPLPTQAADCPPVLEEAHAAFRTALREPRQSQTLASTRGRAPAAMTQDVQASRIQDPKAPKMQDVQAPKMQDIQAPKMQDVQAPKMQDVQAPKMQDIQAPKMQDVQAPKMQDIQAPKMQDVQAPKISKARTLIRQAEEACKKGDMSTSAAKAKEALSILK